MMMAEKMMNSVNSVFVSGVYYFIFMSSGRLKRNGNLLFTFTKVKKSSDSDSERGS